MGVDYAILGTALLGARAGSFLAMLMIGPLLPRIGGRQATALVLTGYVMTRTPVELFAALFAWGLFQGSLDVTMNAQGVTVTVERAAGRPVMSGFHAAWSIGGFTGVALGAASVAVGIPLALHMTILGVLIAIAGLIAVPTLLDDREPHTSRAPRPVAEPEPGAQVNTRPARAGLGLPPNPGSRRTSRVAVPRASAMPSLRSIASEVMAKVSPMRGPVPSMKLTSVSQGRSTSATWVFAVDLHTLTGTVQGGTVGDRRPERGPEARQLSVLGGWSRELDPTTCEPRPPAMGDRDSRRRGRLLDVGSASYVRRRVCDAGRGAQNSARPWPNPAGYLAPSSLGKASSSVVSSGACTRRATRCASSEESRYTCLPCWS
jgi:hypothetical protein